ncbi:hypothetical protein BU23DRAFT_572060 [Bimuria novae-zelandiae CBS 107.79]|uniref:Uncharacterized protein n=1 Tax=Bimuria novae-zelandiae CBS 107.79 TaxID=1447943 RepID=A0A6A5UWM1_9PLEO|nr:hypothetical protein BU23DRAFT_572060 [Bimuria novae-zelandiae CBS 107.79]
MIGISRKRHSSGRGQPTIPDALRNALAACETLTPTKVENRTRDSAKTFATHSHCAQPPPRTYRRRARYTVNHPPLTTAPEPPRLLPTSRPYEIPSTLPYDRPYSHIHSDSPNIDEGIYELAAGGEVRSDSDTSNSAAAKDAKVKSLTDLLKGIEKIASEEQKEMYRLVREKVKAENKSERDKVRAVSKRAIKHVKAVGGLVSQASGLTVVPGEMEAGSRSGGSAAFVVAPKHSC